MPRQVIYDQGTLNSDFYNRRNLLGFIREKFSGTNIFADGKTRLGDSGINYRIAEVSIPEMHSILSVREVWLDENNPSYTEVELISQKHEDLTKLRQILTEAEKEHKISLEEVFA